jgi:hypothetical protein
MNKYSVSIPWHCSVFVKVEAENEEQARDKAIEKATPFLCHHCSENIELGEFNDDYDFDVVEI